MCLHGTEAEHVSFGHTALIFCYNMYSAVNGLKRKKHVWIMQKAVLQFNMRTLQCFNYNYLFLYVSRSLLQHPYQGCIQSAAQKISSLRLA